MKLAIISLISFVLFVERNLVDGKKIQCVEEPVPVANKPNAPGTPILVKIDDTIREVLYKTLILYNFY